MTNWRDWIDCRCLTISLVALILFWYGLQLSLLHRFGEQTALRWFHIPVNEPSPGVIRAVISHDMTRLTHISTNALTLLVIGSCGEPYLNRKQYLTVLVGSGYLSIVLANVLVFVGNDQWFNAGLSGGIFALGSYSALRRRQVTSNVAYERLRSREWVAWIITTILLMAIIVVPLWEATIGAPPNMAHVLGVSLGCIYYWAEIRFDGPSSDKLPPSYPAQRAIS